MKEDRVTPTGEGVVRPRYLTEGSASTQPAFTLTAGDLRLVVEQAVRDALKETRPLLVDKAQLAAQLSCSPSHIDNLRKRGLPTVGIGAAAVRFDTQEVMAWLREQAANDSE